MHSTGRYAKVFSVLFMVLVLLPLFGDDLGWTDLGYAGSTFYETPNLDKLAASGLVFTNTYAACLYFKMY